MNNRDIIKEIIYILIAIIVGVIIVKFVLWLLPVILIAILAYFIYRRIKKNKVSDNISKSTDRGKKKIKVIHDFNDED